jgi:hypothetical protein
VPEDILTEVLSSPLHVSTPQAALLKTAVPYCSTKGDKLSGRVYGSYLSTVRLQEFSSETGAKSPVGRNVSSSTISI